MLYVFYSNGVNYEFYFYSLLLQLEETIYLYKAYYNILENFFVGLESY